jgi:hypothetical protein
MPVLAGARGASRRWAAACWKRLGVALLLAIAGCTAERPEPAGRAAAPPAAGAAASTAAPIAPHRLAGRPLTGATGLELLVSGNPPRLLDIDTGTSRMVAGVPADRDRVSVVQPVGRDAVIVSRAARAAGEVFWLRRSAATVTPVGRAADVAASRDGRGLWLWTHGDGRRCSLREVGLDGRQRRPARRVDCDSQPVADTRLGLLVRTEGPGADEPLTALVDPDDGRRLASYPVVHALAGDLVLWGGEEVDQGPFILSDRRTGVGRQIPRPSRVGQAGGGLLSPDHRLLAIEFGDPAWNGGPAQLMDLWVLDLRTHRWRQLPGMPLLAALKFTSMAWADDGRLLLLGSFDGVGDALAVWRPGQDRLAVRRLRLPADRAGSDSFVPRPRPPGTGAAGQAGQDLPATWIS